MRLGRGRRRLEGVGSSGERERERKVAISEIKNERVERRKM